MSYGTRKRCSLRWPLLEGGHLTTCLNLPWLISGRIFKIEQLDCVTCDRQVRARTPVDAADSQRCPDCNTPLMALGRLNLDIQLQRDREPRSADGTGHATAELKAATS
jgi:hypothetical protein